MSLSTKVMSAIDRARTSLGDLVVTATLTKIASSYDTTTLKSVQVPTTHSVQGFVGSWDEAQVRDLQTRTVLNVRSDDVAFYAFQGDVDADTEDKVTLNGVTYVVVDLVRYSVGASVGLTLLQLRR